ncbi:hypothetical protein [Corynebacterium kalidii]
MPSASLYNRVELPVGGVTVTVFYMAVTNYALANNRIPVVQHIVVDAPEDLAGTTPVGELSIFASVDHQPLFSSGSIGLPSMEAGTSKFLEAFTSLGSLSPGPWSPRRRAPVSSPSPRLSARSTRRARSTSMSSPRTSGSTPRCTSSRWRRSCSRTPIP